MRITVGMSGGVDSSVAAWLLKQEGHEVTGHLYGELGRRGRIGRLYSC